MADRLKNLQLSFSSKVFPGTSDQASRELQERTDRQKHVEHVNVFKDKDAAPWWIPPIVYWLEKYDWECLYADFICGLTIGFMVIPQGISDASVIGIPAYYGLYASFLSVIPYIFFGSSPHVAVGPTAIVSVLTNTALNHALKGGYPKTPKIAPGTSPQAKQIKLLIAETKQNFCLQVVWLITFFSAVFITALGLFRLGYLVNLLSRTVISGFTAAAGIIIATTQLKSFFGMHKKYNEDYEWENLRHFFRWDAQVHGITTALSILFVCILQLFKQLGKRVYLLRWLRYFGPFLVLCLGIIISYAGHLNKKYNIAVILTIPKGMPHGVNPFDKVHGCLNNTGIHFANKSMNVTLADLEAQCLPQYRTKIPYNIILQTGVLVALIGYLEQVAIASTMSLRFDYRIDPDMEAISMGLANFLNAFFRGFPVNGSLSRTAVAADVKGRTPLSNIMVFILVIIVINALANLFEYIPYFCLAAIIVNACFGLFTITEAIHLWHTAKLEFLLYVFTFWIVLIAGIEIGLALAIGLSVIRVLAESAFPKITVLGQRADNPELFKSVEKFTNLVIIEHVQILRIDAPIYFANVNYIKNAIHTMLIRYNGNQRRKLRSLLPADRFIPKLNQRRQDVSLHQVIETNSSQQQHVDLTPQQQQQTAGAPEEFAARYEHLNHRIHFVIFDFSVVTYIDAAGCTGLQEILQECEAKGVQLYLSNVHDAALETLQINELTGKFLHGQAGFVSNFETLNIVKAELQAKKSEELPQQQV